MEDYIAVSYGDTVLAHHGIKGQRWGIRRYQNEDGTRTPSGVKRYGSEGQHKKLRKMSDEDLNRETNRLNKENMYLQAKKNNKNLGKTEARIMGEQIAKSVLTAAISAVLVAKVKQHAPEVFDAGKDFVKKSFNNLGSFSISDIA